MIAQYAPPTMIPESIFNFPLMLFSVIVVMSSAIAIVGTVLISVSIGKRVLSWFSSSRVGGGAGSGFKRYLRK